MQLTELTTAPSAVSRHAETAERSSREENKLLGDCCIDCEQSPYRYLHIMVPFYTIKKVNNVNSKTTSISLDRFLPVAMKAAGGFVDEGQLFIAREAGAEMVGSMGGHTAVANNDQIVEGIYQGVYSAVRAAMSQNDNSKSGNVNVYLDGKQITAAVEQRQRERGATIMTGGVTYGY